MMDLAEPKIEVTTLWADTFECDGVAQDFRIVAIADSTSLGGSHRLDVQCLDGAQWLSVSFGVGKGAFTQFILGGLYNAGLVQGRKTGIEQERERCFDIAKAVEEENAREWRDARCRDAAGCANGAREVADRIGSGKPVASASENS